MKKVFCAFLAIMTVVATAAVLVGCGKDQSKTSATEATGATVPTSVLSTSAPSENLSTLAPAAQATQSKQDGDTSAQTQSQDGEPDYYSAYGGLTGQEAILTTLGYVGSGYQCVYYDQRYLRNQEAWYIGLQASDGSDKTVYYLYVSSEFCVPVTEIPNIGGNNSEDSGVFEENYAGISEQEAIFRALGMLDDSHCVSSEQSSSGGTEYWLIGLQKNDESDSTVYYYYVNADSCFQQ